ncbi:MAG: hypothetical protein LBH20_08440 [Treponema sp.]|jgi:hypothetical protein|nr:hypothetical protein [Treponema sp.]
MKFKALIAVVILSLATAARVHSFGVGAQLNFSTGELFAPGLALTISPSSMTHLAINWFLDFDKVNTIGLTFDIVPLNLPVTSFGAGTFNFTLGAGLFTNVVLTGDIGINAGLRVPIGFNVLLVHKTLEIYTHVAPSFGVHFLPDLSLSSKPSFPIALGARFWLLR